MQKQLNFWTWLGNVILSLLIWPFAPLWLSKVGIFNFLSPQILIVLIFAYFSLGWYLTYRFYRYRMKNYVFPKKEKPYSFLKEIGIFVLIWPISTFLLMSVYYMIDPNPQHFSEKPIFSFLRCILVSLPQFSWLLALLVICYRRNCYLPEKPDMTPKRANKIRVCICIVCALAFLSFIGMIAFQIADFIDDGHRDYSPKGTQIRLTISEKECGQYPNRYYFKNLCILCPDEKPMVDGHCQRCPAGQFVISNGCRSCDSRINYITPKAECDACPNRVYEGGLCKPLHHLFYRGCDDNGTWYNTSKADCDACPNRKYVAYQGYEGGNCELILHGWQETTIHRKYDIITVKDRFYDEQGDLSVERKFYDAQHLGMEKYIKEKKTYTYFRNGQLRTEETLDSMKGYYENGILAFEQENEVVKFYNKQGQKIGFGTLIKRHGSWNTAEIYVLKNDDFYSLNDTDLLNYFKENYPIDFRLPFDFVIPTKGDNPYPIHYLRYNEKAEMKFEEII